MPQQKKYPDELRQRAIRLVFDSGRPIAHVARDLGINPESLRNWVRQAEADEGRQAELLSSTEREELKTLRSEVRELRRANEILRSASVFSRPNSTHGGRSERLHRQAPRRLRGRANLPGPGGLVLRLLRAPLGRRSARAIEDERLAELIRTTHAKNYSAYGYRRTWKALLRAGEQSLTRCRVQRLMREAGIQGAKRSGRRRRTTTLDPGAQPRPDLVKRDFSAEAPNRLWVADLTYLRSWEGPSFLAFVIDVYSRLIVGWLAAHMRTDLVLDALRMALGTRQHGADVELVHHSDRGSQYTSADVTQELTDHRVLASVGSVGDAYDNALAESFVDSFKTELIADRVWRTRSQLELAVVEYISWFNNDRLHESLGDIPPAEFEALHDDHPPPVSARPPGLLRPAVPDPTTLIDER